MNEKQERIKQLPHPIANIRVCGGIRGKLYNRPLTPEEAKAMYEMELEVLDMLEET